MEQVAADLASDLRFLLAVVVVQVIMRGIADGTNNRFRDHVRFAPTPDRIKRLPVNGLVLS